MGKDLFVIVIIVGGASVIPFIAGKLRIPSAILEIVYGIILFNLYFSTKPEWFVFLKEIGLIYLMFIAGMELDFERLVKQKGFFWYIVISLIFFIAMPLLFVRMGYPYYLGIAVSVVSAGIVIPVMKELDLMRMEEGKNIVGLALTGEFLSIVVLASIDIYHIHGLTFTAAFSAVKFVILIVLAILFLKILYVTAWWNPERVGKVMESEDPVEEGIRAIIFIVLSGALLAVGAGVEPILGSFVAGIIFSAVFKNKGRFEDKINAVGFGFFVPFFFVGIGADFDVDLLGSPGSILFALFLSLMVLASNIYPLFLSLIMKKSWAEAVASALLLSAPLSMMIVASTIGIRTGTITADMYNSLILAAMISSIIYPSIFRPLGKKIHKAGEEKAT